MSRHTKRSYTNSSHGEHTTILHEEPHRKVLKLRAAHSTSSPSLKPPPSQSTSSSTPSAVGREWFPSANSNRQHFTSLLRLEDATPIADAHMARIFADELLDLVNRPAVDSLCSVKALTIVGRLASQSNFRILQPIVEQLIAIIDKTESQKVTAQAIGSLIVLSNANSSDKVLRLRLLKVAFQNIDGAKMNAKVKCLSVISSHLPVPSAPVAVHPKDPLAQPANENGSKYEIEDDTRTPAEVVCAHAEHNDARVRAAALDVLLNWHKRGIPVSVEIYAVAKSTIQDNDINVRLASLQLISLISQMYPESFCTGGTKRICDDGFEEICNCINDSHLQVRALAAELMGKLENVSFEYLEQTLDKKLMSNLRRKLSAHQRNTELFDSSQWKEGVRWGQDRPQEKLQAEDIELLDSGCCGAVIHGLEDEYYEVREKTVDSLCKLALKYHNFAKVSQDFLVDMFNDEIESVRLESIYALCKMSKIITLQENQLDVIINLLKDSSYKIRQALREMFASVRIDSSVVLSMIINALLDNMKRYQQDKYNIWECMSGLGKNNHMHTYWLANNLLHMHLVFQTQVPDINDPAYVAILVEVINATAKYPQIATCFPEHTMGHYRYLRRIYPELIPELNLDISDLEYILNHPAAKAPLKFNLGVFLKEIKARLASNLSNPELSLKMMRLSIRDLNRVINVDKVHRYTAECQSIYIRAELYLFKYLQKMKTSKVNIDINILESPLIEKVLNMCREMQLRFSNLSIGDLACIHELALRAQTLLLVEIISKFRSAGGAAISHNYTADDLHDFHDSLVNSSCFQYLNLVNKLQRFFSVNKLPTQNFTEAIFMQTDKFESMDPYVYLPVLKEIIEHYRPGFLTLPNLLNKSRVTITSPVENSDQVFTYISGATIGIDVIAEIWNVEHIRNLRLQVEYADGTVHLHAPRLTDFSMQSSSSGRYRLEMRAILNHATWSDRCTVHLQMVSVNAADVDCMIELDASISTNSGAKPSSSQNKYVSVLTDEPVRIFLMSKPCKW